MSAAALKQDRENATKMGLIESRIEMRVEEVGASVARIIRPR